MLYPAQVSTHYTTHSVSDTCGDKQPKLNRSTSSSICEALSAA